MNKQFNYINIVALLCIVSFTSCEKMPDVALPTVVTNEATNIRSNEAVLNAAFSFDADRSFMVKRAFEISDSEKTLSNHQYYYDDEWTTLTGSTIISANINSLSSGTNYYYRAVLFPKKIDGKFIMLSRPSDSGHTPFGDILLSQSPDMKYWGEHRLVMQKGGQGCEFL